MRVVRDSLETQAALACLRRSTRARMDGQALAIRMLFILLRSFYLPLQYEQSTAIDTKLEREVAVKVPKDMAIRMLEYGLAALRKYHFFPTQVCLYVGERPARMKN